MNAGFDPTSRVIVAAYWERNHVVATQLQDNFRLCKEERITARKVQLVFKPIVFQDWRPPENLDRYWDVRRDLNKLATDRQVHDKHHEWVAEAADYLTDED